MLNMEEIDPNFKIVRKIEKEDIVFYDVRNEPFQIYGVKYENGLFRRMPEEAAKRVNKRVGEALHAGPAGGRVRFRTDSPYIGIVVKSPAISRHSHLTLNASLGFDLYIRIDGEDRYVKTFMPAYTSEIGFEYAIDIPYPAGMYDYTINFTCCSWVSDVYVGVSNNATIEAPTKYRYEKPIVYYGSSITGGACATRPGMSYEAILTRRFDIDHINLGFSGNAFGEMAIAEYIRDLDMTVFVYDYDHNAPTAEHLEQTHERMFKVIRDAHPDLPIIMMPRPKYYLTEEEEQRAAIVKKTYDNAKAAGDNNVYYIDGRTLMKLAGGEGTVDGTHPTDLGFASMATAIGDVLEKILK